MPYLQTDNSALAQQRYVHLACSVIFWIFSFFYLFLYQADVLAAGQHVLSHGKTHYNSFIGAVLITLTLHIMQIVVFRITKLGKRAHAITYFPSLLALTIVTDVSSNINKGFSFGGWYIALPLLLAVFAALVWALKQIEPFEPVSASQGLFSREMWVNVLTMVVMFVAVGIFSNGDEAFHYRMRMEKFIADKKYVKAIKVGRKSTVEDTTLTMLRSFALSQKGLLGEKFFEFPFALGERHSLMPDTANLNVIFLPDSVINMHLKNPRVRLDYRLVDLLVDKEIEDFSKLALKSYPDSAMPKHYAEALAIWKHNQGKLSDDSLLTSYEKGYLDFIEFTKKQPQPNPVTIRRKYKKTYWYFYKYGKSE